MILGANIVIYFTKAILYKLKSLRLTLKLLAMNSIPSLHRKQGIQIQRKELLDTQSAGANHQSTVFNSLGSNGFQEMFNGMNKNVQSQKQK